MGRFDAGVLGGSPPRRLSSSTTVHGPVVGTVTVHGRPYALARARTTYGRDALSLATLKDLTEGRASSPARFLRIADELEWTFNVFWVSARHIGYFSAGRLPRRAPGINSRLPTLGTGRYDWRGFLSGPAHPHAVDPRGGLLLNWNNRPAPGWIGGDNTRWSSVQRAQLFRDLPRRRVRLEQVVGVMNRAATRDLRAIRVWPAIRAVLGTGPAPDARTRAAAALVTRWVRRGASRLDRNLDGTIDDPGAAVLDAAFVPLARAALSPVLGPLTDAFALLYDPDQAPYRARNGSAFADGWYGYLDKDLRTLLGRPVRGRYSRPYCGRGRLAACRASLWAALKLAADGLAARQGPKPAAWRSDATLERIRFRPGLIPDTMRWVNRPTFQQVLELAAPPRRRPRFTG